VSLSFPRNIVVLLLLASSAPAIGTDAAALKIKLPFAKGTTFLCSQGWHGALSHSDGINDFAYDFALPEGTPVLAAASGRVLVVSQESKVGGNTLDMMPKGNLVWIDHGGGSFTLYEHLKFESVPVREGQLVNAGQFIGLSGNTGYSTGPHLHFAVTNVIWRSVPSRLADVGGDGVPIAGRAYTSGNDGCGTSWFTDDSTLPLDVFDGVVLTSSTPSTWLDSDAAYLVRGSVAKSFSALRFFITGAGNTEPVASRVIPVSSDGSGSFQFWLQLSEYEKPLEKGGRFWFGIAPIRADGGYWCRALVPFVPHRRDLDESGRLLVRMQLPFPAAEHHRYHRVSQRSDAITEDVVSFCVPEKNRVVSSAAGRVIAVGSESERSGPKAADGNGSAYVTSAYVIMDHGDGLTTEYVGLATDSIAVHAGDLVQGGCVLGLSSRTVLSTEPGFVFSIRAPSSCDDVPSFAELGANGFLDDGEVTSQVAGEHPYVFQSDSIASESLFEENGIGRISGAPAHTFHDATRYAIRGEIDGEQSEVAVLVRRRGDSKSAISFAVAPKEQQFQISVRLADRKREFVGDGPWEWAVTARKEQQQWTAARWEPLALMR